MIRSRRLEYVENKINACNNNKELWKFLSTLVHTKKSKININNPQEITATELNDFFVNEPINIAQNIQHINSSNRTSNHINEKYSIPLISEAKAEKIICGMNDSKAVGYDKISVKFAKMFKSAIIPIIVLIINMTIVCSRIPTALKISRITPIHKSGERNYANNYRPISNISLLAKVMEKHIFNTFYAFIENNTLLSSHQFGFRKAKSTCDALIRLIHNIVTSLNDNRKCALIMLDLRKAFDLVDHQLLI